MNPAPTHNPTTDAIRARYLAALANRPALDPGDARAAAQLVDNAVSLLRHAYRLLRDRPDLTEPIERAAGACKAISYRLERDEGGRHGH